MLTLHDDLKGLVACKGTNILQSPYLLAYMADMEMFREPDHRPFRMIFRQMAANNHIRQISLQWASSTPSASAYSPLYPAIAQDELRYAIDCIGYALSRIDNLSPSSASVVSPSEISQTVNLEDDTVEYISHGSSVNIGTLIPAVMASPVHRHLNAIAANEGGVAEYVQHELMEPSVDAIRAKISGEQIDGVALALRQITAGRAFVLGDMTGIGKGRQLAMLLKWAQRNGYTPVYVTEKSMLFNDLYRDLRDIGYADMRPFILNHDANARITDQIGNTIYNLPTADEREEFRRTGSLPAGYNFLLMTYSQVNMSSSKSWKPVAVLKAITDNILILDESHNASGINSNIGNFFRQAVEKAAGVCFASATYAKYPSSMPIYALKTALSSSNIPAADLIEIVSHGGPILQEVMAQGLVESGSMIRRQRDMKDVERSLDTPSDTAVVESLRMSYDSVIELIDDIREFHKKFIEPYTASIDAVGMLKSKFKLSKGEVWMETECSVHNWNPHLRLSPTIRQLLFSLKTEQAIARTLEELRAGRKPIVQISRTMGSNISRLIKPGESCDNPDFALTLMDCIEDLFHYEVSGKTEQKVGKKTLYNTYRIPVDYNFSDIVDYYKSADWLFSGAENADETAQQAQDCYDLLLNNIRTVVTGLPLSPIDYFKQRIAAEGYRVGELTQRNIALIYDDVKAGPNSRVTCCMRKNPDKKGLSNQFNNGLLDVLIGNRVMASGISLHSSEDFADSRPRTMITWEQQDSADAQTQFDGRADRTGQISRCKFVILASPVPAEMRYLMMNSRKQRSLNANVEANQGNDTLCNDIFNKYGARVIEEFATDNPELAQSVMDTLAKTQNTRSTDAKPMRIGTTGDFVAAFMRNLGLLSCKEQDTILSEIINRYNELLSALDTAGENDLKVTVLPLQATLVKRTVFAKGKKDADSPFAEDANLDEIEINVLRKPLTSSQIIEHMSTLCDETALIPKIIAAKDEKVKKVRAYYAELRSRALQQLASLATKGRYTPSRVKTLEERANNFTRMNNEIDLITLKAKDLIALVGYFKKGSVYVVPSHIIPDGQIDDPALAKNLPMGVFMGYNVINDTYTRSRIQAVFAVNDSRSLVKIPLTEEENIKTIIKQSSLGVSLYLTSPVSLSNWDATISHKNRERAYIITGNILSGIAACKIYCKKVKKSKYSNFIIAMASGRMVKYTDINGNIRTGYMLSRSFHPKTFFDNII